MIGRQIAPFTANLRARSARTLRSAPSATPRRRSNWLAANSADLIVTDYDMPRIDGDEFISRFRALPGSAGVPIMMVTVCGQRQKKLRALESGATDFLRAPVDHFEFLARARNLLKLSQSAAGPAPRRRRETPSRPRRAPCSSAAASAATPSMSSKSRRSASARIFPAALRGHLRERDFVVRLDPLRYAVLQNEVASPADARALSRRLAGLRARFGVIAALRAGSALPRPGAGRRRLPARGDPGDARDLARRNSLETPAGEGWRLAPLVDLASGALAGAQLLRGADEAELRRSRGLARGAGLRGADKGRRAGVSRRLAPRPWRRRRRGGDPAPGAPCRRFPDQLPPLDLLVPIDDMRADAGRLEKVAHSLKAFGPRWVIDLGPPRDAAAEAADWPVCCASSRKAGATRCAFRSRTDRTWSGRAICGRGLNARPARRRSCAQPRSGRGSLLPALRRVGVDRAQGACFGAPFAAQDFSALLGARAGEAGCEIEACRA